MVTLSNATGDGGVSIGVDAFGAFGSNAGGTETSDAVYNPVGEIEGAGTVFESFVGIGIVNDESPERTFLASRDLEAPEFTNVTSNTATSNFSFSGLDFVLEQEVSGLNTDGQRTGSNLAQTYTVTNPGTEAVEFEVIRYLDGDLDFDASIQDTGGRFLENEREVLFETDSGDSGTDATTFIGITADGSNATAESYEISQYFGLRDKIVAGEPLNNTVQGDGEDEDQFVESDPYDITLSLGDTFTLAPGESITYTTTTTFGSGVPEEVAPEIPVEPPVESGSATIQGIKFEDLNEVEPGLAGVDIYLDLNNNGQLDTDEPVQTTAVDNPDTTDVDETGRYAFTNLLPGTYTVREIVPQGFEQTFPLGSTANPGDGYADVILEYFAAGNAPSPLVEPYGSTGGTPPASPFNDNGRYTVEPVDPSVVLGAPPPSPIIGSNSEVDWLSISQGSYVTVGFTDETVIDAPGDDIFIRSFDPEDSADENADVFVSSNGIDFEFLGTVNEQGLVALDLADIGFSRPVTAVRVVGGDNRGTAPGFDLIGVEVLPESSASPGFYTVELEAGEIVDNIDFGNVQSTDEDSTGVPVYRFLRTDTQTQFYTTTELERDTILDTLPQYELEGISFVGASEPEGDDLTGVSPVYRFFNQDTGIHLYTADENEAAFVEENLSNYAAEGVPYYGYDTQVEGTVPLYRFYNESLDAHFYTPSAEERDEFLADSAYQLEGEDGIAFYVEPAADV